MTKYKRNNKTHKSEKDQLTYLDLLQNNYPYNRYDGWTMPTQQMQFNSGSFWQNPTLGQNLSQNTTLGLGQNSMYNLGQNNTPKLSATPKSNFMSGLGEAALGAGIGFLGNMGGNLIAGGKSSGIGNTIGSLGNTIGSAAMAVNPLVGGVILGGTSLLGGAFNAIGGVKLNKKRIAQAENEINAVKNFNANASNFDDLSQQIASQPVIAGFSQSDIGSDGLFSNKAKNKYRDLLAQKQFAEAWADRSIANNATNLQQNQMNNLLTNYAAYGGGIHIAPSKRGTFTAAAKKHGKGVQEFASQVLANKENYSPAMVKKANFARNAAKWHHAFGGDLLTNGTVFSNGVTTIGNGNTHENNPYEGVQMGVDSQGIPNLVEEGETIWNDYVFSNRIPVPDAVRNKYKLRGTKDMTFSDAAKKIQKASEERPNDPIANDTLNINLTRLAQEQETIREQKDMNKKNKYDIGGTLRYASALGPAIGLGYNLLTSPDYSYADQLEAAAQRAATIQPITYNPIDTMMTYRPFDQDYLATKAAAQAAATRRNIMNISGGNRANAVGSLLASDYNAQIAQGEALRQGDEFNWNRLMQTQTFNRGTKKANAEMALKATMANQEARLKASQMGLSGTEKALAMKQDIDAKRGAAIRANLTGLFNNLGNIGIDMLNRKDRDFYINTVVPNLPIEQYANVWGKTKAKEEAKRRGFTDADIAEIFKANGGKLNRKKRGGFTY